MITRKHDKPGPFPTPPGTCIIKPDLPLGDGTRTASKNWHPFIVVKETDDSVECVMGRTLYDARTGKDRRDKLQKIEGAMELTDPCPPMDYPNRRRQYVDAGQVLVIPKKLLFLSTDVEICSFKGDKLSQKQTDELVQAVEEHAHDRFASRKVIVLKEKTPEQTKTHRRTPDVPSDETNNQDEDEEEKE